MFQTPNVSALFKKATLKLVKGDDDTPRRVAELALVFEPFVAGLAREIGEDVASHLFDDADEIREELSSVALAPRVGLLRVTARAHEKAEGVTLDNLRLPSLTASVKEDAKNGTRWIALTAVLDLSLETAKARGFVLEGFGRPLLWTFESMQRDLLEEANFVEAASRLAAAGGPGSSVSFGIVNPDGSREKGATLTHADADRLKEKARDLRKQAGA